MDKPIDDFIIDTILNDDLDFTYRMRLADVLKNTKRHKDPKNKRGNLCIGLKSFIKALSDKKTNSEQLSLDDLEEINTWIRTVRMLRSRISELLEYSDINYKKHLMEKMKAAILKEVPTPEEWAAMKETIKKSFKIFGMGLAAISGHYGIKGDPTQNHSLHLRLGRIVYGSGHKCLEYKKKPKFNKQELIERIKKVIKTPEQWAAMKKKERETFNIEGIGLIAIARKFNLKGNPVNNKKVHLDIGKKIFGEHKCLEYEVYPDLNTDELKAKILVEVPTFEHWSKMTFRQKRKFRINGMSLNTLGKKFRIKGNPTIDKESFLELGQKIYSK